MSNHLFDALLGAQARRSSPLLIDAAGATMSYAAFHDRVAQLAHALTTLGIAPGDRVAVQVEKSPTALALYVACVAAGAVYLPLNTAYTAEEVSYFAGDAQPKLIVCDPGSSEALSAVAMQCGAVLSTLDAGGSGGLLDIADGCAAVFDPVPRGRDDVAAILYTSGTTGRSKGAVLTHGNLVSNALTLRELWRFTPADCLLHALPVYHVHGLFVASNVVMTAGASMLFLPRFDAAQVTALLRRATVMMGVPTFYTRLLSHPGFTREASRGVRVFISGSAPLLPQTFTEFEERTGQRILERYGMTETGMLTSNPYDAERRAGSVGLPLPGVDVRIADAATGHVLPQGDAGVIEVSGPNVFSGYWQRPDLKASEFRPDGYFITGDVGRIDAQGYVHIVGRAKDLIITGGLNVYPKEIESLIDAVPGVVEAAVFGVPHEDFGEAVAAAVVAVHDSGIAADAIKDMLAPRLAAFKQPKAIFIVDDLPRNAMGKVQKNVLRERYKTTFVSH